LPVVVGTLTSVAGMIAISRLEWTGSGPSGEAVKVKMAWPWFTLTGTILTLTAAWLTRGLSRRIHREEPGG
jgi:hypothetical protein